MRFAVFMRRRKPIGTRAVGAIVQASGGRNSSALEHINTRDLTNYPVLLRISESELRKEFSLRRPNRCSAEVPYASTLIATDCSLPGPYSRRRLRPPDRDAPQPAAGIASAAFGANHGV